MVGPAVGAAGGQVSSRLVPIEQYQVQVREIDEVARNWLKTKVAQAQAEADRTNSPAADKALAEVTADLEKYKKLVQMGGY